MSENKKDTTPTSEHITPCPWLEPPFQLKMTGFVTDKENSQLNKDAHKQQSLKEAQRLESDRRAKIQEELEESTRKLVDVKGVLCEEVSRGGSVSTVPHSTILKYGQKPERIKVDLQHGGQLGYCPDDYMIS